MMNKIQFHGLADQFVALLITDSQSYQQEVSSTLKTMVQEKGFSCIYMTFNRSVNALKQQLSSEGIDIKNFFFIDAVSAQVMPNPPAEENCIFVRNPQSVGELGIAVHQAIDEVKGKTPFLLVDSISGLLTYTNKTSMARFVYSLCGRVRLQDVSSVLVANKSDLEGGLSNIFMGLMDKTIVSLS